MAISKWSIRGVGYVAGGAKQYDFTHRKTDCDLNGVSEANREGLRETYHLKLSKNPDGSFDWSTTFFLSGDTTEQTAVEGELTALGVAYTVDDISLTSAQQQFITDNQVEWNKIEDAGAILQDINNISNIAGAKTVLKKILKLASK